MFVSAIARYDKMILIIFERVISIIKQTSENKPRYVYSGMLYHFSFIDHAVQFLCSRSKM